MITTIKFLVPCTLEVSVGLDADGEAIFEEEIFQENEVLVDVTIFEANSENLHGLQFGNGDVTYVPKKNVEIIEE